MSKKNLNKKYLLIATVLFAAISLITSIFYINQSNKILLNTYIDSVYKDCRSYFNMLNNLENSLNSTTYEILRARNDFFSSAINNSSDNTDTIYNLIKNKAIEIDVPEIYIYHKKANKLIAFYSTNELYASSTKDISELINAASKNRSWYFLEQGDSGKLMYLSYDFSGFYVIYTIDASHLNKNIEQFSNNLLEDFYVYMDGSYIFDAKSLQNNVFKKYDISQFNFEKFINKTYYKKDGYLYICNVNYFCTIIVKQPVSAFSSYKLQAMQKLVAVLIVIFLTCFITLCLSHWILRKRFSLYNNVLKTTGNIEHKEISSMIRCAYTSTPVIPKTLDTVTLYMQQYKSFVAVLSKSDFKAQEVYSYSHTDLLKTLSATIIRTVSDTLKCCSVICSGDTVITLIYSEFAISKAQLYDIFEQVQSSYFSKTGVTSSHLLSNTSDDCTQLYSILIGMNQFTEFRFLYGYNSIVHQSHLNANFGVSYPTEIVQEISKSIIHSNPTATLDLMNEFFSMTIDLNSPNYAKEWIVAMLFSVCKDVQLLYSNSSSSEFQYIRQILDCTTIDECIILMQNIFPQIELIRVPQKNLPNEAFKQQVIAIVSDEYMNLDMNISYIAEKMNLTSAYFGQKFSSEFNMPFNTYLSQYRINCSMKLLANTSEKITDISLQCGFSSAAYFTKTFREHTNMTPSQYRSTT